MSADHYKQLIAQLETRRAPNRELGREILLACGWRRTCVGHFYGPLHRWTSPDYRHSYDEDRMPCPTESIDMALTLVPDGLNYVLRSLQGHAEARVGGWKDEYTIKGGHHTVPAIALCIAALKARAEEPVTESASTHDVSGGTK